MDIEQFEAILNILEIGESSKSALVEAYRNAIQRAENREGRIKSIRDQNAEHLQSEIDRLTAQNLQLRLICDRAVVFLLAGSVPDQTLMDDKQLGDLNEYMDSVDYNDLEECKSTEHGFHKMLIEPLLNAVKEDPDKLNLLKLAMAEQNRCKLVAEEVQQLEEIKKLRPDCGPQIDMATWAFRFAHEAGGVTSKAELVNLYSPAVNLARSAAK